MAAVALRVNFENVGVTPNRQRTPPLPQHCGACTIRAVRNSGRILRELFML